MTRLFDYHTHSHYCDGEGNLADYVECAAARGVGVLACRLMPLLDRERLAHEPADLGAYLEEARALARSAAGRVEVLVGLEVDYVRA